MIIIHKFCQSNHLNRKEAENKTGLLRFNISTETFYQSVHRFTIMEVGKINVLILVNYSFADSICPHLNMVATTPL
jgi:hypothetical protein